MSFREQIAKWNLQRPWKKASGSQTAFIFSFWSSSLACFPLICSLFDFVWSARCLRAALCGRGGWVGLIIMWIVWWHRRKYSEPRVRDRERERCAKIPSQHTMGNVLFIFTAVCASPCWVHGLGTSDFCQIQALTNHYLEQIADTTEIIKVL